MSAEQYLGHAYFVESPNYSNKLNKKGTMGQICSTFRKTILLKASKSQKQILVSLILPKNE